jgi:hypothetical protein
MGKDSTAILELGAWGSVVGSVLGGWSAIGSYARRMVTQAPVYTGNRVLVLEHCLQFSQNIEPANLIYT